jgi:hypothetical protein
VFVAVDTFASIYQGSEIDNERQQQWVNHVRDYVEAKGAAVLVIHHPGVNGQRERGTTNLKGAMDVSLELKEVNKGETYKLCCSKPPKSAPAFADIPLRRVAKGRSIAFEVDAEGQARASTAGVERSRPLLDQNIETMLMVSGREMRVAELVREVGQPRSTVNDALGRLASDPGTGIVQTAKGTYRWLSPAERSAPADPAPVGSGHAGQVATAEAK